MKHFVRLFVISVVVFSFSGAHAAFKWYGKLRLSMDHVAGTQQMNSNASRLGIKGDMKLGGNWTTGGKYEMAVVVVDIGATVFTQRNQGVWVESSKLGRLTWGTWDGPYKNSNGPTDVFKDTNADHNTNILTRNNRYNNNFFYDSRKIFGDFNLQLSLIPQEAAGSSGWDGQISTALAYAKGPLYVALAAERWSSAALTTTSTGYNYKGIGSYTFNNVFTLGAVYSSVVAANGASNVRQPRYYVSGAYVFEKNKVVGSYGDMSNETGNEGVDQIAVGIRRELSSSAEAYALASFVDFDLTTNDTKTYSVGYNLVF